VLIENFENFEFVVFTDFAESGTLSYLGIFSGGDVGI
jgi:hypothetical protein